MASNFYIKFDGVDGESTDENHAGWTEILSWNHGFTQPASPLRGSTGSTIERADHQNLSITKYADCATDALLKACWSGKQFETVKLECLRSDGENQAISYLVIDLDDVIVSNYNMSGAGGDLPMENLNLAYSKVTYTYVEKAKADGAAGGNKPVSHDLKTNAVA